MSSEADECRNLIEELTPEECKEKLKELIDYVIHEFLHDLSNADTFHKTGKLKTMQNRPVTHSGVCNSFYIRFMNWKETIKERDKS